MSHPETVESFAGLVWCESKLRFEFDQSDQEGEAIRAAERVFGSETYITAGWFHLAHHTCLNCDIDMASENSPSH